MPLFTDQQVIEIRARHEFGKEDRIALAREYGCRNGYMFKLLSYEYRGRKAIPTKQDYEDYLKRTGQTA